MNRMLPLSFVLTALIAITPQTLSAKPPLSIAAWSAGCFTVLTFLLCPPTFGVGIAAAHEPAACDLNSEYNITVAGSVPYGCRTCNRGVCTDGTCSRPVVYCQNATGAQIDGQQTNNPRFNTLIVVTIVLGASAAISLALSIAGCVGMCVFWETKPHAAPEPS